MAHTRQKVVTFEACNFVQGANYQITSISSGGGGGELTFAGDTNIGIRGRNSPPKSVYVLSVRCDTIIIIYQQRPAAFLSRERKKAVARTLTHMHASSQPTSRAFVKMCLLPSRGSSSSNSSRLSSGSPWELQTRRTESKHLTHICARTLLPSLLLLPPNPFSSRLDQTHAAKSAWKSSASAIFFKYDFLSKVEMCLYHIILR